jgi:phosphoglycolate phosphatase-like HAD superfamily hydrolase
MRRHVSVLITDLDNTLYDWVEVWHRSFSAMLRVLVDKSGIPQEVLEREIRGVHQRHGTSEYAFLIEELPSLQKQHPGADLVGLYEPAIRAYREARDESLRLYPTVLETLWAIKEQGSLIVAYTESMAFYTAYRLRNLGLDGLIDYLYSPPDHDLPEGLSAEQIRRYPLETYEFKATIPRHTPKGTIKPNPTILREIIRDIGAPSDAVIYVGDSLMKDIPMAKDVGVLSALAQYGEAQSREEYELLRRVSHWTDEDVAREKEILSRPPVEPTVHLHRSFAELLAKFEFVSFDESTLDNERISRSLEAWKVTVTVQQHFNDIEMRVRNFALTLLVAIIGASALAIENGSAVTIFGFKTSLAVWLLVGGVISWMAFYFVDQIWYHRLLVGAVRQGVELETLLKQDVPGIGLTSAIGKASPAKVLGLTLHSKDKMKVFYFGIALMLVAFAVAAHFNAGISQRGTSQQNQGSTATSLPSSTTSVPTSRR